ncbi:MAG: molybdopterin-dependent oxidoreductase [Verrucomicrobiales bacterium]|nr:molybdopterin-dependent oxidoreductase [Verrucomicrobiales bacterium]
MNEFLNASTTITREESPVMQAQFSRREILQAGLGGMAMCAASFSFPAWAFPPEEPDEELVSFLDMPRTGENRLDWETLADWLTPQDQAFNVQHYGIPEFDEKDFKLEITGLVAKPMTLRMEELKRLPRKDQLMTLECSGNGSAKGFMNAVYNSRWTGTPLAPLLKKCRIDPRAKEIVFLGMDRKKETLRPGTNRELTVELPYGRSMSIEDARKLPLLLAYARNGEAMERRIGAPLRLIVPGWYGVANVKWLTRIDVRDRRYMGRYMGRDYVTVRGERRGNEIVYLETSVARMNLKSVVARVTRRPTQNGMIPLKAYGAAWNDGSEIKRVEVQVDGGSWRPAVLDAKSRSKFCWVFFSIDLGTLKAGKHVIVSRAIDVKGRIQPSAEDDEIALKKTYWEAYQQWPREIEVRA